MPELCARIKELGIKYEVKQSNEKIGRNKLKKYKGIILSGGPLLLDKKLYLKDIALNITVLLDAKVPIVGICLGHQIISEVHGSCLSRLPKLLKKMKKIRILKMNKLFKELQKTISVQEAHHECIGDLADEFEHIATSKSCKYEGIKHKGKEIYGVQFHPALSRKE
jgi:GMP synthase (glutamine-hydrolysing)